MRVLLCALLLTASTSLSAAEPDTKGWNGTTWGQSEAQVLKSLTTATATPREASDGFEKRLKFAPYRLAGVDFTATLFFDPEDGGLGMVSVDYKPDEKVDESADGFLIGAQVERLLHKKYGPPSRVISDGENLSGITLTNKQWILPTTTIRFVYAGSSLTGGFCSIVYESTQDDELDKL